MGLGSVVWRDDDAGFAYQVLIVGKAWHDGKHESLISEVYFRIPQSRVESRDTQDIYDSATWRSECDILRSEGTGDLFQKG